MKLFGDRGAANYVAAFQQQRLQTFFCEIKRSDERVVAAAENHDFALRGHGQFFPLPVSFRISRATRRPGAPMIPAPGWVAGRHMYNFLMGVRYRAQPAAGRKKKSCSSESSP